MKAIIFDIQRSSFVDGPGIRTTVFFKGCNLRCKWCHNPESQIIKPQIMFYKSKCISCGKCREACPNNMEKCDMCGKCTYACPNGARRICGREYTVSEVLKEILKDKAFYETSGGGVTFSGGECMLQIDFLEEILKKCKENKVHTAVDTAGCIPWEYFLKIMPYTNLFLYDVKCFSDKLHILGTNYSNKLILENLKKLSDEFLGDIIIRIPVIGGFNDDTAEIRKICGFIKSLRIKNTEILPYHKMGQYKYEALGMKALKYKVPDPKEIKRLKEVFCNIQQGE